MDKAKNHELDEQLKELAIQAQQQQPMTQGRQLALRKLVNGIVQSGRISRPQQGQFFKNYEDIYDDWSLDYRTFSAMSKQRIPNGIAQ